jgi:hypothetical protein
MRLNPNDKDLCHKALNAAQTEDEVAAYKTCLAKQSAESKACDAALESLAPGDAYLVKRAVNPPRPVPWQDHIMSLSGSAKTLAPCGFTILYPKVKDADCSFVKERMERHLSHTSHEVRQLHI